MSPFTTLVNRNMSPLVMFALTTIAAFLVAATAAAPASASVAVTLPSRADYPYNSAARKFYKPHRGPVSLDSARKVCREEGAEVAYPDTPQELEALGAMQRALGLDGQPAKMWLGIYAFAWRTVDQNTVDDIGVNEPGVGLYLAVNGSWLIADFTMKLPFVCEISEAAACNASVPGYALGPDARSCYKLDMTYKNWTDALLACHAEGAQLAIIDSQQEADYLAALVSAMKPTPPEFTHIGFMELFVKGKFFTLDGKPLAFSGYDKWATGEPNNLYNESCGSITVDGRLNDISCAKKLTSICEKKASAPVPHSTTAILDTSGGALSK